MRSEKQPGADSMSGVPDVTAGQPPVGAVMVVGAGIAGVQASLDLANAGYRVYLVEKEAAIGGRMARLDKTFPTNDCAMCILSPKLVDAGQHFNVQLMTNTDLLDLDGFAGNFKATVRHRPRYVDSDKCIGCGDCVAVCPVTRPDAFNAGLADRKAVYCLYPQAVPSTYAIEKIGRAPCTDACPAGVSAQGYIALIQQRRYADALRLIRERIPFPSVCGRTCHHPCEGRCNRRFVDEPVAIQALKRFVTDRTYLGYSPKPDPLPQSRQERIAIVGAGPAGLTAAQDLVKLGYSVTVFEALPEAGGMMRFGIPEHRLPKDVLRRDISDILALGVELHVNAPVADPGKMTAEYHAVYLAVGVHGEHRLGVEGEELEGVVSAIGMLRSVNLGQFPQLGKRVAVVGGGITAVDAATTALRLGAQEVYLIYRRRRGEIPAYGWELDEAESEGVRLIQEAMPTRILGSGHRVSALEYVATQTGPKGPDGRPTMVPVPGTELVLPVDTVIRALGQSSDLWHLQHPLHVYQGDPETLATTTPGLFAGPGQVSGAGFIINAIAQGHHAATSIHRYIQGEPLIQSEPDGTLVAKWTRAEAEDRVSRGEFPLQPRVRRPLLPLKERVERFIEVDMGYTESMALAEASRCLDCGVCSECGECEIACQAQAIVHEQLPVEQLLRVGAVILAPGYKPYGAELSPEYGWGRYPNVVTSLQFERLLSASGPTLGHVRRPSDGRPVKRIAFIQCVGSRDQDHGYCSSVCCMYATKEAIMAVEHDQDVQVQIFMMDMRAFSKGYEEYHRRAQEKYGIQYTRCRISAVRESPGSGNLVVRYLADRRGAAAQARTGEAAQKPDPDCVRPVEEEFDLVVLSVGMEISSDVIDLGRRLGIELDEAGFCQTAAFEPLTTSRPGVFAVGPFREPKDIPESVVEASGAAAVASGLLSPSRWTLTGQKKYPPVRDVADESPRIGVFVCHCGSNIAGFLDVSDVVEYAKSLPHVVHAEDNLYTCSQDSIARITDQIGQLGLNRVVVAACTPLTHEPLFQDSLRSAGLNPYLFEMANIRNQCSWVHSDDWDAGTDKARDLVRMAVVRAARLEPLDVSTVPVEKRALIIGGGPAGMNAALTLADQGVAVTLIEREAELGGNLRNLRYLWQPDATVESFSDPRSYLSDLIRRVAAEPAIDISLQTELISTSGFKGNYRTLLYTAEGEREISHGVTIVATGGEEYSGDEYGYGSDSRIVTMLEFERSLADWQGNTSERAVSVVMIMCAGMPAEQYCSRVCCSAGLKNALMYQEVNPEARVAVLYQDMRTYGFKERLYTEARRRGILFVRYDRARKPEVAVENGLTVRVLDQVLGREIELKPDLLVLGMPLVPAQGAPQLASALKVGVDLDGWFMEAHAKLRPVDFATEGLYVAGTAHYPKLLDEAIVQAQAAAGRAMTILSRESLKVGGVVAQVEADRCVGCLTCIRVCPFDVPRIRLDLTGVGGILGAAHIESAQCQGCGICVGECPARAIQLLHYRDGQMEAKIAAFYDDAAFFRLSAAETAAA